jgi:hypothetical protein
MKGGAFRRLCRTKYEAKAVRRRPALQRHFVRNVQGSGILFREALGLRTHHRVAFQLGHVLSKVKRGD